MHLRPLRIPFATAWLSPTFALAVAAPADCPEGERRDAAMSMCMPIPGGPHEMHGTPDMHGTGAHAGLGNANANAAMYDMMISPDRCGPSGYFHFGMSMCLTRPRLRGSFSGMVMGAVFLADVGEQGPRGRRAIAAPNWAMLDLGVDLASWNRLELDAMFTAELVTLPERGYPELLQIGESNARGEPFIDAQHPHSTPLMGLTLSDVISFSAARTRLLRLSFAPRGESFEGPIAFMHRPTGTVNPDAPLGHHIGQDVGHISSTVLGASLYLGRTVIEASAFHGREPEPTQVDLPLGAPDSYSLRLAHGVGPHYLAAASFAYVNDPEGDPEIPYVLRMSASLYTQHDLPRGWRAHGALIWGGIANYDRARFLNSLTLEALFRDEANALWTRAEAVQRTPAQLRVDAATDASAPNSGVWAGALTIGYTRRIVSLWAFDFGVGGSGTVTFLPAPFEAAYGGAAVVSGKLFLEARLLKMFSVGPRGS